MTNARAQAMYMALPIFFHRRIYDLDAAMLWQEVDAVRDAWARFQLGESGHRNDHAATLIWPAFIAGCEAVSCEAQGFFSSWFESCYTMTGLVSASVARRIVESIWTKRKEVRRCGTAYRWPEVLRSENIGLMCT